MWKGVASDVARIASDSCTCAKWSGSIEDLLIEARERWGSGNATEKIQQPASSVSTSFLAMKRGHDDDPEIAISGWYMLVLHYGLEPVLLGALPSAGVWCHAFRFGH